MENTVTISLKEYDDLRKIRASVVEKVTSDKILLFQYESSYVYYVLIGDDEKGLSVIKAECEKEKVRCNRDYIKAIRFIKKIVNDRWARKKIAAMKYDWEIADLMKSHYYEDI